MERQAGVWVWEKLSRKDGQENNRGLCIPSTGVELLFYVQEGATEICSAGEELSEFCSSGWLMWFRLF